MNLVIVHGWLDMLRNFFERVLADACEELDLIEARRLAGEFASFEDYENGVDRPFVRIEVAARAVAYELVALVEGELHDLAHEPWLMSSTHKGPKNIFQLSRANPETLAKLRMVSDLPFDEVVALKTNRKTPRECIEQYSRLSTAASELTKTYRFLLAFVECDGPTGRGRHSRCPPHSTRTGRFVSG